MSRARTAKQEPVIVEQPGRTCANCGTPWSAPEYSWDAHLVVDGKRRQLVDTCSSACREALGFPERKATP